jgi:hypothetical protein
VRVVTDGSDRYRPRGGEGDLEEGEPVPGGGGVDDDQVPGRLAREAGASLLQHHDLAEHHELPQTGGGGEEAAVDRTREDPAGEKVDRNHVADVLVHDRGRIQVDRGEPRQHLGLAPLRRRPPEKASRLDGGGHLDEEDAPAAGPGGEGEGRPHDALADSALAGKDDQPPGQQLVEEHSRGA